jgi:hypothetical protein
MLIYQNSAREFIRDIRDNAIADKMGSAFAYRWGRSPGAQEFQAWRNSLSRIRDVIELAEIEDTFVALEYEVPFNQSRIDCLLFGRAPASENVVLVELKQWHVKNIYRALLTRGMKGCFVYFVDKETEKFCRDRIEAQP